MMHVKGIYGDTVSSLVEKSLAHNVQNLPEFDGAVDFLVNSMDSEEVYEFVRCFIISNKRLFYDWEHTYVFYNGGFKYD